MLSIARVVRQLSMLCGIVAAATLGAACVVVCQMVFVRRVLGESTVWQTEFVTYAIVAATLVGSPYVLAVGGHVNVDLLGRALGPRGRRMLDLLAGAIGVAFCAVLAASGWRYFHEAWAAGWTTETVWAPPLWVVLLPLPLGAGVLTLQYVVDLALIAARSDAEPGRRERAG